MQYGIIILVAIICILWVRVRKSEHTMNQRRKEYEAEVRVLTEKLNTLLSEKEKTERQNFQLKKDFDYVTSQLANIQNSIILKKPKRGNLISNF